MHYQPVAYISMLYTTIGLKEVDIFMLYISVTVYHQIWLQAVQQNMNLHHIEIYLYISFYMHRTHVIWSWSI